MDVGRRMTISQLMNKMGPGIVGSDRRAGYGQAIYHALTTWLQAFAAHRQRSRIRAGGVGPAISS